MLLDAAQLDLLQRTIGVFYGGTQEQIAEADKTLDQLRGHPQPWCLVQQLVDVGSSPPAVLWSVSLVEQHLKRRWRRSTADERAACRSTVVALVMAAAAGPPRFRHCSCAPPRRTVAGRWLATRRVRRRLRC